MPEGAWDDVLYKDRGDGFESKPSPRSDWERREWAEIMLQREPYGLKLKTFPNKNYALFGHIDLRCDRSGGVWFCKHRGKLIVAETLPLLCLKIVEVYDRINDQRMLDNCFRPLLESAAVAARDRNTGQRVREDEEWPIPDINLRSRFLPSEVFFGESKDQR